MYPLPRTVSSVRGCAGSSRSFSRSRTTCMSIVRVDTPMEVEYLEHGGILPHGLRQLLGFAG